MAYSLWSIYWLTLSSISYSRFLLLPTSVLILFFFGVKGTLLFLLKLDSSLNVRASIGNGGIK